MTCIWNLCSHISTSGATATQSPHFGPGAGFIVLEDVNCNGNEANLTQCRHRGFRFHNCVHRAGVFCGNGKSVHWMILRQHYMYALYPHTNQSVSVHSGDLASYMFIASTEMWTVRCFHYREC